MLDVEHWKVLQLADAYKAADIGTVYFYVAASLEQGWLARAQLSDLMWYEKLVLVDREESQGFLRQAGSHEDFALIGISQGFILFRARNAVELADGIRITRPWVETVIRSWIEDGTIDEDASRKANKIIRRS